MNCRTNCGFGPDNFISLIRGALLYTSDDLRARAGYELDPEVGLDLRRASNDYYVVLGKLVTE